MISLEHVRKYAADIGDQQVDKDPSLCSGNAIGDPRVPRLPAGGRAQSGASRWFTFRYSSPADLP